MRADLGVTLSRELPQALGDALARVGQAPVRHETMAIARVDATRANPTMGHQGRVHYRTGLYFCWIDFGSFGMGVAGSSSECFWDVARPGDVGGSETPLNDPVTVRWPNRVQNQSALLHLEPRPFPGQLPAHP